MEFLGPSCSRPCLGRCARGRARKETLFSFHGLFFDATSGFPNPQVPTDCG